MNKLLCTDVFYENQKLKFTFNQRVEEDVFSLGDLKGNSSGPVLSFDIVDLSIDNFNQSYLLKRNGEEIEVESVEFIAFKTKRVRCGSTLLLVTIDDQQRLRIEVKSHLSNRWGFDASVDEVSIEADTLRLAGGLNPILSDRVSTGGNMCLKVFAEQQLLFEAFAEVDNEDKVWSSKLDLSTLQNILHSYANLHFWLEEIDGNVIYRSRLQRHVDVSHLEEKVLGRGQFLFLGRFLNSKYFTLNLKRDKMILEKTSLFQEGHRLGFMFETENDTEKLKGIQVVFPADSKIIYYSCEEISLNRYKVSLDCHELIKVLVDEGRSKGTFIMHGITVNNIPVQLTVRPPKMKYSDSQRVIPFDGVPYELGISERKRQGLVFRIRKARIVRTIHFVHDKKNHQVHLKGASLFRGISIDPEAMDVKRFLIIRNRLSEADIEIPLPYIRDDAFSYIYRFDNKKYDFGGFDILFTINGFFEKPGIYDFYVGYRSEKFYSERKLGFSQFIYKKDHYLIEKTESLFVPAEIKAESLFSITPGGNLKFEILHHPKSIEPSLSLDLNQDIWLIGERPDTAQDTGYHFFKYCRETYPDKQFFYAIDGESKDYEKVKALGNVVTLNSSDHIYIARHVTHVFGSHDLEYFLPYKLSQMKRVDQIKKIFLQHGVMGRKSAEYHKFYYNHPFDLVITSSDDEKKMFIDHFRYKENEIAVTGLSRFDYLYRNHKKALIKDKKVILLMPTWREWLHDSRAFEESRYFKEYLELLRNERLSKFLEETDSELWFYPHYRMQPFLNYFMADETSRIKVVELGSKSVQELLMSTHLLITDYSSVSFDYSFMKKPVIFFHFDFKRFFRKGILRPMKETFLGSIVGDTDSLIEQIIEYQKNDYQESEEAEKNRHLILKYVDDHNCERIVKAVRKLDQEHHFINNVPKSKLQSLIPIGKIKVLRFIFMHRWILKAAVLLKRNLRKLGIVK
ncbi:hypothetical protein EVJ27_06480 [Exiguobacterium sp. SH3S2]|uniref:CDP-glycerol glycerophosphotransferase family protein n=1 Tax=unclassified Exiguobacterium TaxID=2644629 RepID=UPI00103F24A2|nr:MULTISPECIES: CDP-glycerol glycerophosphotransferase family protein [unclassified Exiguobacterium]TCI46131.1 hypothetical protein EVJ28_06475 [Exiguobacterium sp. SH3S3]TCI61219.1 hypothetical protein EVJ27_06480 [Exiguobacterium sp. SH3S2]